MATHPSCDACVVCRHALCQWLGPVFLIIHTGSYHLLHRLNGLLRQSIALMMIRSCQVVVDVALITKLFELATLEVARMVRRDRLGVPKSGKDLVVQPLSDRPGSR